jgi:hypothetical protein
MKPVARITLKCPSCGKCRAVARLAIDYPEATTVHFRCEDCNHGDFDEPMYFDARGRHIIRDPETRASPMKDGSQVKP